MMMTAADFGLPYTPGQLSYMNVAPLTVWELRDNVAKDSLFRMYSMTKPVTATAIMMLYEEGKLMLNDPVSKYIPSFAGVLCLKSNPLY